MGGSLLTGTCDHVEVEICSDLLDLGRAAAIGAVDAAEVGLGTQQSVLFGAPEGEADGVLDLELCEGFGDLEHANGARAIVVDARAGEDRVLENS